jgi:transposase, IS30 family
MPVAFDIHMAGAVDVPRFVPSGVHSNQLRIGKSFQTVYREIKRNRKPDGAYQPFWAHNQALSRRKRPKQAKLDCDPVLRRVVRQKLDQHWSPSQISRFLIRTLP